ncbi:RNA polymerase sigma factor [Sciscionella marina]|uniref:RNA polymerase sigma factor n=1 Tax=Sciscionella marina TaxID=508770 RepID=UPI000360BBD0|nr:sigma-70 family RNA polymerase sigma factor [Sciscionella marina]
MTAVLTDLQEDSGTWSLVSSAQSGDMAAFGALYRHYAPQVFGQCLTLTRDRVLAEDCTSETFVRALARMDSLRYRGIDIGAWLGTIARNIVLDHLKSGRSRREVLTAENPETGACEPQPDSIVLADIARAAVRAALDNLDPSRRRCLVLRFFHGYSVVETARMMNRTPGAIKVLQHRAIRALAFDIPSDIKEFFTAAS